VTKDNLQIAHKGAVLQSVCGEGVAQVVGCDPASRSKRPRL
jgi:hypothetical protein